MKAVIMISVLILLGVGVLGNLPEEALAPLSFEILGQEETASATVIFTGDIMLDRYVGRKLEQLGDAHTFGGVADFLREADFVAGNLEGPITSHPSVSDHTLEGDTSNMRFTFPKTTPALLRKYNVGLVSLGNNHIFDFGREGVEETKRLLEAGGISFIGDPLNETPDILIKEVGEHRFAFVGYNEFFGQDVGETEDAIRVAKDKDQADRIIVMAHWGDEYVAGPPPRVVTKGRAFIDAGADLVIGSHPHVVQKSEDYNGGRIYYSLGNFAFDQYWSPDVMCGMAVVARFEKESITYTEQAIGMTEDGRTVLGCR